MCKVQPIPEELWGALNYVSHEVKMALAITHSRDTRLTKAVALLDEYGACFGADGRVSQRGEIPQCWNQDTIFTPHREVGEKEKLNTQLEFDWDKVYFPKMINCPMCRGKGYRKRTDKKTNRHYPCDSCKGEKEIPHPFQQGEENGNC